MEYATEPIGTSRARRVIIAAVLLVIAPAAAVAVFLTIYWPFTRQSIIDALQEQSARSVEITNFRRTYFPPGCVAGGVRFLHRVHKDKPPIITIRQLIIRGSYFGLLRSPVRINEAQAIGLRVTVPPRRPGEPAAEPIPLNSRSSGKSVVIDRILANEALIEMRPAEPRDKPFTVSIHQLTLENIADNKRFSFRTALAISKPPGEITASGFFGPWDEKDPGRTVVRGSYTYSNANLGVFEKLAGTLTSEGQFEGALAHLAVSGKAGVPNLHIDDASHTIPLSTEFQAIVNATNGDTFLQPVEAHEWKTNATITGKVAGKEGETGKTVDFQININRGRAEDLFRMFVRAKSPPISGTVSLRASARVPPLPQPFLRKLEMQGDFGIAGSEFRNRETQSSIARLSQSATHQSGRDPQEDPETVLSDLTGHVAVSGGVATFTKISFGVPGAWAELHGTFGLISKKVDFHGKLTTTGSPAAATSGFKSFFLKMMTPFLRKKPAVTVVPFKITGHYEHLSVGLDFGGK